MKVKLAPCLLALTAFLASKAADSLKVFCRRPSQSHHLSLGKIGTIFLAFSAFLSTGEAQAQKGGPPPQLPASNRIHSVSLPGNGFATETFDIADGKDSRIELTNCTSGAAPVIRVFQTFQTSQPQEIERGAATAVYFVAGPTPEALLVHAEDATSAGTCDWSAAFANYLSGNSGPFVWQSVESGTLSFGGATITVEVRQDDRVHAGYSRVGADNLEMLITPASLAAPALQPPEFDSVGRRSPNDVNFEASGLLPPSVTSADLYVIVGTSAPSGGKMRILVNDELGIDADEDGLGSEFEAALGTCDDGAATLTSGWPCWTNDPKNTDGDVLSDYQEIFGASDSAEALPFGWMGADPARRDIFLERDWDTGVDLTSSSPSTFYQRAIDENVLPETSRALSITDDHNMHPSGEFGIFLHVDIAGSPGTGPAGTDLPSENLTTFDLGGSNPTLTSIGGVGGAKAAYDSGAMSDLRKNYFRYQVSFVTDGSSGNSQPGGAISAYTSDPIRGKSGYRGLHELGHNFGLKHGGSFAPQNLKLNYFSIMNYRFQESVDSTLNPTYPTVGFSVAEGEQLDPQNLCESEGLGFSARQGHLDFLADDGTRLPDTNPPGTINNPGLDTNATGGVDWNRDGIISNCSRPVEFSLRRGASSEISVASFRQFDIDSLTTAGLVGTPTLALADKTIPELFVIYVDSGRIHYQSATYAGGLCNDGSNEGDNGCLNWGGDNDSLINASSVTAAGVDEKIYVISRSGTNLTLRTGVFGGFDPPETSSSSNATGDLHAVRFGDEVRVFWRDSSNQLWEQSISVTTRSWTGTPQLVTVNGSAVVSNTAPTAVVVKDSELLLTYTNSSSQVSVLSEGTSGWETSATYGDWEGIQPVSNFQVGVAWRPDHRLRPADTGYLVFAYRRTNDDIELRFHRGVGADQVNRSELPMDITDSDARRVGAGTAGVSLLYPPGSTNVMAATQPSSTNLLIFPKVDGIGHAKLDATDDFLYFSECSGVVSSESSGYCDVSGLRPIEASNVSSEGDP